MKNKFDKNQKSLLIVHALRVILELFTSTFMTSYILSLNPENVLGSGVYNIGIFYISWFGIYAVLYFLISFFVDKSNRVSYLRIGIIVNIFLLSALVIWGDIISHWIVLAGALCGISDAFYYSSYLIMRNELNARKSMKKYNLANYIFTNCIKIIIPILLGLLIDITTYSHIAIYVLVLTILQFIITFMINSKKPENSSFELKKYFKKLKQNKELRCKIKYTYLNAFVTGFKTTYKFLVTILTIYTFKTNLSLGIFTSIFAIVTMILLIIYKRFDSSPKVNKFIIYLLLGVLPFAACILLVLNLNTTTLVIYNLFLSITIGFSDYFGTVERDAIIKNLNLHEYIAEHQLCYEIITCFTRIIACTIFIIVGLIGHINAFKILLIFLLLINPIKYFLMYKQREIRKELEETQNVQSLEFSDTLTLPNDTPPQV